MSVVTLVAVNKYILINYPGRARGLGSPLAHSPLWRAINLRDRHHLRVQASGVQQEGDFCFQKQRRGPSKTFLALGSPSGILHLIGCNECLFQTDYYENFYYFKKR